LTSNNQYLAVGTSGSDFNISSTSETHTFNIPSASASNRGLLTSANWSTFNGKESALSFTSPLSRSTNTISIPVSTSSIDGYLNSTDWNVFNGKQPAGNYITSLIGEATGSGAGAATITLTNSAVIGKVLTGINITGGTVTATDSILTGFGKLQNQINGLIGSTIYAGVWNASTNSPTLTSSVGTKGTYYVVSTSGSTNLNGVTDWSLGDWAIYNGTAWNKVDNSDSVSSVNGQTGAVSLTTDNVSQGSTNLYFSNASARSALSFAAGSGAYNSTTGVITIPTNNNQITNGSSYIALTALSGTAPIGYNNTTGAISITQAATAANGYLSSTDWNTFNNKQATLSLTTTGSSGAATLVGATLNIPNYGTALSGYLPLTGGTLTGQLLFGINTTNSMLRVGTLEFQPVGNGNNLIIDNGYYDGTSVKYRANGYVNNYQIENGNYRWYTGPSGIAGNTATLTEKLTLLNNGNVGIGTTSPVALLNIYGSAHLQLQNSTTGATSTDGTRIQLSGSDLLIINRESADIILYTSDTERIRIASTGAATFSGSVTATNINSTATQTTVSGSTSGSIICSMPFQGSSYKKVIIYVNNLTSTLLTYTYPVAFTFNPMLSYATTGTVTPTSDATHITISGTSGGGWITLEGY
jgi:hypothetical protein